MESELISKILSLFKIEGTITDITQFRSDEDGAPYQVWKIDTDKASFVLKKTTQKEQEVYEAFFSETLSSVPRVYGFREFNGERYMVMEYVRGTSLNHCTRESLTRALDAMIEIQAQFWEDKEREAVGYNYEECRRNREKRLAYMDDLRDAYSAYLKAFSAVPRTLCNDDMLPFNVLDSGDRVVIIDWEFAGILPYPCALARLLAYGEDDPNELFQMTQADKEYAVKYYFDNLIRQKGIGWEEYLRTMKLFFLKEYSEWVYLANQSGDQTGAYYQKYSKYAKELASQLGLYNVSQRG